MTWRGFLHYWLFVRGIHLDSPHKGPIAEAVRFSLMSAKQTVEANNQVTRMQLSWNLGSCLLPISFLEDKQGTISCLTHLLFDKMATISQKTFIIAMSWMKIFVFWFKFHRSLFLRIQLNNSAMVQVMAWRQRCDKPLSEPRLTQCTDAYKRH